MKNPELSHNKRRPARVAGPTRLSDTLQHRLNSYALAAGMAGVASLACAPSAEAAPICKDLSVRLLTTSTYAFNPAGQTFAPFQIAQTGSWYFSSNYGRFWNWNRAFFTPNSGGANVLVDANGSAVDVAPGASIGPGGQFQKGASYGMLFTYGKGFYGQIGGGTLLKHRGNLNLQQPNYVGFQFSQSGEVHYGWVRLRVTAQQIPGENARHTSLHILGYGYEIVPNAGIAAGSCKASAERAEGKSNGDTESGVGPSISPGATLGMLAAGGDGLSLRRKGNSGKQ